MVWREFNSRLSGGGLGALSGRFTRAPWRLTCVRFREQGRVRSYALFLDGNKIVHDRFAVQTDSCDLQTYTPSSGSGTVRPTKYFFPAGPSLDADTISRLCRRHRSPIPDLGAAESMTFSIRPGVAS
jgi:hypothetical protein